MTRSNLLWGLGGAIIGAVATYFVMEYVYDKEINQLYADFEEERAARDEELDEDQIDGRREAYRIETEKKRVLEITDAEQYKPSDYVIATTDDEGEMDEAEDAVMQAILDDELEHEANGLPDEDEEQQEDPDEEGDDVNTVAYDGISIIDVSEVQPGRRIVTVFNHDNCTLEVARQMSVRNHNLDEVIDEDQFEGLIGPEAENILMNTEPGRRDNMLAVRNNIIGLDFVIRYSSK